MIHELKTWPCYYEHVVSGNKTFEVRENDRGFQPGDHATLKEWDPDRRIVREEGNDIDVSYGSYTGREIEFKIGYVFPISDKKCVFSLIKLRAEECKLM